MFHYLHLQQTAKSYDLLILFCVLNFSVFFRLTPNPYEWLDCWRMDAYMNSRSLDRLPTKAIYFLHIS